jgi:hypothetical protein
MTVTVTEIREVRTFRAGDCTISVNTQTGLVSVVCTEWDELNGSHYWSRIGTQHILEFLAQLRDCHYVVGKLFGSRSMQEVDEEATTAAVIRAIREAYRDRSLTRQEASESLESLREINLDREDGIYDIAHGDKFEPWYCGETRDKACVGVFWACWVAFCNHLRDHVLPELRQTGAAAP